MGGRAIMNTTSNTARPPKITLWNRYQSRTKTPEKTPQTNVAKWL